ELLHRLRAGGPQPAFEAFDVAVYLDARGDGAELERVPGGTRWLDAAKGYARGDHAGAAATLEEIGSLPDAAYARLRRGLPDAFFERVGATAYADLRKTSS